VKKWQPKAFSFSSQGTLITAAAAVTAVILYRLLKEINLDK
jgi:hypothetical protein